MKNPCKENLNLLNSDIDHALDLASFVIALPFVYSPVLQDEAEAIRSCLNSEYLVDLGTTLIRRKSALNNFADIDDSDIRAALKFHIWATFWHEYPEAKGYFNQTTVLQRYVLEIVSKIDFEEIRKLMAIYDEISGSSNVVDTVEAGNIIDHIKSEFDEFAVWLAKSDVASIVRHIVDAQLTIGNTRDYINSIWDSQDSRDLKLGYKTKERYVAAVYEALHNEPEDELM